jgi:hypothetical protein
MSYLCVHRSRVAGGTAHTTGIFLRKSPKLKHQLWLQCREALSKRAFRGIFDFSPDFSETLTKSAFQKNRRNLVKNPDQ